MGGIFNILAVPLGIAMKWLYALVQNYGWAIIIFTFLVRIVMIPLSLKQQKSTARMSAYNPMIQEIQKKWANDKNRANQEIQKFYEENNIKMSVGCAPMLINMLVLFGVIAVIQAPLDYILQIPTSEVQAGVAIVQTYEGEYNIGSAGYSQQSILIGAIKEQPEIFTEGAEVPFVNDAVYVLQPGQIYKDGQIVDKDGKVVAEEASLVKATISPENIQKVQDFHFQFLGLNLASVPTTQNWVTLIMPILSLLTMVASQLLMMKLQPSTQGRGQMIMMTVVFGVMFGFFAFRVPAGFSLYYTVSNVVMTLQQFVVKKIYDPEKIREEVMAEIEANRAAKKAKKKVVILDESSGEVIDKELNESEIVRLRLAKARELDAQKYGDGPSGEGASAADDKAEKARQLDAAKYKDDEKPATEGAETEKTDAEADGETEETVAEADAESTDEAAEADTGEQYDAKAEQAGKEYKPGRRKRARQNKEGGKTFAEQEKAEEETANSENEEEK